VERRRRRRRRDDAVRKYMRVRGLLTRLHRGLWIM